MDIPILVSVAVVLFLGVLVQGYFVALAHSELDLAPDEPPDQRGRVVSTPEGDPWGAVNKLTRDAVIGRDQITAAERGFPQDAA